MVSPISRLGVHYVGPATDANMVGTPGPYGIFQEYIQSSPPDYKMNEYNDFSRFSMGVIGEALETSAAIPTISGLAVVLFALGLAVVALIALRTGA
jgi:hypothetical protein